MKRRYTVLALVAGVHATAGLIVLAQSQNASQAGAGANKGGTATPQGTGAGPFVTQFHSISLEPDRADIATQATSGRARESRRDTRRRRQCSEANPGL